jgi:hypothetical protein
MKHKKRSALGGQLSSFDFIGDESGLSDLRGEVASVRERGRRDEGRAESRAPNADRSK